MWTRDGRIDRWCNGRCAITDEVIYRHPRAQVQAFAVRHTGEELPPEAFPDRRGWQERFIEMWADVNRSIEQRARERS